MAEAEIGRIAAEAAERWPLHGITVIHRTGKLAAGREHRARRHRLGAPPGGVRGREFPDGLPQDQRPLLEEGARHAAPAGWVEAKADDDRAADRWR